MASKPPQTATAVDTFKLGYETNPIVLVGGAAGGERSLSTILGDKWLPSFRVLPGHTLINNQIATYPLADQTVAANAVITQPLQVSLEMILPASALLTVASKRALMKMLKTTLDQHTALGGWYNVSTPSYIYLGCLLANLVDSTEGMDGAQVQSRWVWSFIQPLLTSAANSAQSNPAMAKIASNTQNAGNPPGSAPQQTLAGVPSANAAPTVSPSVRNLPAANVNSATPSAGTPVLTNVSPIPPGG